MDCGNNEDPGTLPCDPLGGFLLEPSGHMPRVQEKSTAGQQEARPLENAGQREASCRQDSAGQNTAAQNNRKLCIQYLRAILIQASSFGSLF